MQIEDFFTKDRYSAEELRFIIEAIPANVFYKDTKCRYQLASHVCKMLNGEEEGHDIIGKTDLDIQVEEELGRQYYEEDLGLIENGGKLDYISEMHFGGETYYYEITKQVIHNPDGDISGIVGMVTDMTELISLQKELERLSTRDTLTGCYNRTFLARRKAEGIDESLLPLSIVISDCDNLKHVNDNCGHDAGDEYICKTVAGIRKHIPPHGEVVRLGGDEFLTLMPNCTEDECRKVVAAIKEDGEHQRVEGTVLSSSFGVATITSCTQTLSDAMSRADAEMYETKQAYRSVRPR